MYLHVTNFRCFKYVKIQIGLCMACHFVYTVKKLVLLIINQLAVNLH